MMSWTKILQVGLGTAMLCLVLAGAWFLPASGQEIDILSGEGEGDSDLYLPLMLKPFMLPDVVIGRVSLDSAGTEGNDTSAGASISADGRYVTFVSFANNLVSGDSNGRQDVFVHDRADGQTWRVSAASDGTEGNNVSAESTIAADGRYVAFSSFATNLVSSDTNARSDIFVHGLQSGQTSRVSVTSTGAQVSGDSEWPALSADGRYVAFQSSASNLVADDSNGFIDVFVHDRQSGETTLVSMASGGTQGNQRSSNPTISGDGRYVAFVSYASNLVTGDTNNVGDIFVHDRQSGQTNRVSVASGGGQANDESIGPVITADGRYVAFTSDASNLVNGDTNGQDDVFVHDRQTGQTNRISLAGGGTQGNGNSSAPAISADGRYVAFSSAASNLVTGDSNGFIDIFIHDRQTGQTTLVSTAADGTQGNLTSSGPAISADGRYIAFTSSASNLVNGDTNNRADVFVYNGGP